MEKLRGLEISTQMGCRLNCVFCPQDKLLGRYYENNKNRAKALSLEGFKKALDSVEKGGFISFCGMVEPFHNDKCADMILYAYENGYRVYLFTTLMGMTESDFEKIKDVKFDFFELHIADAQERSHFVIDDTYKRLLKKMQENFNTYTYCCHGDVHPEIKDIIDSTKLVDFQPTDRAGILDIDVKHFEREAPFLCAHGFQDSLNAWIPVMLPDGTVVACCNDYGMKHQFGNLIENSWDSICKSESYIAFRKSWEDKNICSICNQCVSAKPINSLPAIKLRDCLKDKNMFNLSKLSLQEKNQLEQLARASRIIIRGAGNYFKDHYEYFKWNECLNPVVILDSNQENEGKNFAGTRCMLPHNFEYEDNDLVVVFVKKSNELENELKLKKIDYLMIDDIFRIAGKLIRNEK